MTTHLSTEDRETLDHFVWGFKDIYSAKKIASLITELTGINATYKRVRLARERLGLVGQVITKEQRAKIRGQHTKLKQTPMRATETKINQLLCKSWL